MAAEIGQIPSELPRPGWGMIAAIGGGALALLAPQFALGIILGLVGEALGWDTRNLLNNPSIVAETGLGLYVAVSTSVVLYLLARPRGGWTALRLTALRLRDLLKVIPAWGIYFVTLIVVFAFIRANFPAINLDQEQEIGFEAARSGGALLLAGFVMIVAVPFSEELLFRGWVFQGFRRRLSFITAAVATSLLFGLAHQQLNVGIDTFLLGMVSAWLIEHTKSLWPSIVLHASKNAVAFYLVFVNPVL